ncbi:MAG: hypothetical protein NTY53_23125, partial [Kiritimatiellaeota bacterium]|nr:hypothetical protein [Kiritimatiellota bacterium]
MNKIIWFIGGFLLGVIVTVAAMKFGAYFLGSPQNDEIVVAATSSMPVGTILGYDNLGKRTVHGSQLPKDYIQPDEVSSLIGHKLIKTVEEKQVLTWRDVDAPNPMPLVRG